MELNGIPEDVQEELGNLLNRKLMLTSKVNLLFARGIEMQEEIEQIEKKVEGILKVYSKVPKEDVIQAKLPFTDGDEEDVCTALILHDAVKEPIKVKPKYN